jgi:AcrR family transcriptional regulator
VTDAQDLPGARGGYAKGAARRSQILAEMIRLIAENGVDASSLRTVAAALGISQATLRHHFPTRDELLVAVYRAHDQRVADAEPTPPSAIEDMRSSAERNRAVPGLVQLYTTLAAEAVEQGHPVPRDFVRERFDSLRARMRDSIEADQRAGRIRADLDATDLASLAIAASDGLQVQWLLDPEAVDSERILRLLESLVRPER